MSPHEETTTDPSVNSATMTDTNTPDSVRNFVDLVDQSAQLHQALIAARRDAVLDLHRDGLGGTQISALLHQLLPDHPPAKSTRHSIGIGRSLIDDIIRQHHVDTRPVTPPDTTT